MLKLYYKYKIQDNNNPLNKDYIKIIYQKNLQIHNNISSII